MPREITFPDSNSDPSTRVRPAATPQPRAAAAPEPRLREPADAQASEETACAGHWAY